MAGALAGGSMNTEVVFYSTLAVNPGQLDAARALLAEIVANSEATEPGTLEYACSFTADGSECFVCERYADPAAALAHMATFGQRYVQRFLAALTGRSFVVSGPATPELRQALAQANPTWMELACGFRR